MEKKTSSFVSGAAILAAAGLLCRLIGAVFRIPLSNLVDTEGMRYYELVYRYYSALLVISSSGLPTAISKLVSERVTLGDYRGARAVFNTAFRLLLLIGIGTTLIMFLGADLLAGISYPADAVEEIARQAMSFRALAPALLFVSLMCAYRGYLQGMQRMTGTAISQIIEQIGKLAFGYFLARLLLPKGAAYAAMGALIGVSISEFFALAAIFLFYRRNHGALARLHSHAPKLQKGWDFKSISQKLLAIAIPVTLGASIMPITGLIDGAMIIRTLEGIGYTVQDAGNAYAILYSNVTPIINMPAVLTTALAMSLVPTISAFMTKKDYARVKNASRTGLKLALIVGTPCAVGLFVLAEPVLNMLYTHLTEEKLALAVGLMKTACVGVLFLSIVQTLTGVLQGLGKPNIPVINLLFGGILKVLTLIVLMRRPDINIQGAAVSTVVCYAAAAIMDVGYLVRMTHVQLNILDVFCKPIGSSIAMGVTVHYIYQALSGGTVSATLATLASVIAGVAVYGVLVIVLRMFSSSDLAFIPGGRRLARFAGKG